MADPASKREPTVAVIVVSYNTVSLLRECLSSIQAVRLGHDTEIVVVDNNSADDSARMVARDFPKAKLIVSKANTGFGSANNIGVRACGSEYVVLLNSDTVLQEDTIGRLVDYLDSHRHVSCVAPRIVLPDGARQPRVFGNQPSLWRLAMQATYLGVLFPRSRLLEGTDGSDRLGGTERHVGWVSGVCMAMRRADFLAIGGFDEAIFMYCEDLDLCARLSCDGRNIVRVDRWPVRHYGGASSPTIEAQVRSTVWAQRNLLKVVSRQHGPVSALAARLILLLGLAFRLAAGLARIPQRGLKGNLLLRASLARLPELLRNR